MQDLISRLMADPQARANMERVEDERRARAAEAIARHGSAEAVMAETPREAALRLACAPFEAAGRLQPHHVPKPSLMPEDLVQALLAASPLPDTVAGALAAYDEIDGRVRDRVAVSRNMETPTSDSVWERLLERHLDTLPAVSFADIEARLAWMQRVLDFGYSRDLDDDQACLDALKADIAALAEGRIVPPGRTP